MWYTTDGSDPTNAAPSVGPISSGTTLSLQFPAGSSNLTFKVIAFRDNYQPSAIVPVVFSATNFVPNSISFGFASGEASSEFIGSPGQIFYAPVTLSPVPGTTIYSLQFNLTVTNAGWNPGPAVTPGAYCFQSLLEKPDLKNPGYFINDSPGHVPHQRDQPAARSAPGSTSSSSTMMAGSSPSFQRQQPQPARGGLAGALRQDQPLRHQGPDLDRLLPAPRHPLHPGNGQSRAGRLRLPDSPQRRRPAKPIKSRLAVPRRPPMALARPVRMFISPRRPMARLTNGAINSIKIVTAGQRKYVAGDCAPFRWFNAGDFGNTNLDNSDVMQVFQSAIYSLELPAAGQRLLRQHGFVRRYLAGSTPAPGYLTMPGP